MADTLQRLDLAPGAGTARPSAGTAAPAVAPAPGPRRGPFRPEAWLNARQRGGVRLASHYFRTIDVLAASAVALACARLAAPAPLPETSAGFVLPFALGCWAALTLIRSLGLYRFGGDGSSPGRLGAVFAAALAGGGGAAAIGWLVGGRAATLDGLAVFVLVQAVLVSTLHLVWGSLAARWRDSGALKPNIVIVGATRHAERLIARAMARGDVNVIGVFDDRLARSPDRVAGVPVLGRAGDLASHRIAPYVDRIVLAIDPKAEARVRELAETLAALPTELTLLVDPERDRDQDDALARLAQPPLAALDARADADRRAFNKRLQDLVVGAVALVLLAPLMALIALAIRLDGPGPIFFRQRRHGFNNEAITVWKFRTMRPDAADATAARQVTGDDDRITRVGRFLRPTSLDELPQLLNVLAGEMSLVGPRPHAIGMKTGEVESSRLVADYARRHRIKPGMTGWAAIHGSRGPLHSAADVSRRVRLDVEYIERQSFWLDLYVLVMTVPVLLGDRLAVR
jgi:Undecaprenyl-phosphate glucose phosphotransferase